MWPLTEPDQLPLIQSMVDEAIRRRRDGHAPHADIARVEHPGIAHASSALPDNLCELLGGRPAVDNPNEKLGA